MAGEWIPVTLGKVLSFANGKTSPERSEGLPYPVYGSNGVIGFCRDTNAPDYTIVIGRVGSYCGSLYLSKQKCWVTDNAIRASALDDNNARFLFYLLSTLDLNHWRAGSGQPLLNQTILGQIPASVPLPNEQRAIAHILGTLDDKIELNRRMNETLEAMARALFKSWFVDFLPVRVKMAARTQTGDPLPAPQSEAARQAGDLPKHLADLFPDSFVDSELGEIPKGWEVGAFADTIETLGGGTPKTSVPEYWNGAIPWFSVVDAPSEADVWVIHTEKKITQAGIENSSTRILPVGTTIITARGTVGRIALVGVPMAMNQSCYGLRGKADIYGYYTYFATRQLVSSLQQRAHGSVFDTITRDTLAGVSVVIPSVPLVKAYEEKIASTLERIRSSLFKSLTLAAVRDALLPKLISGELRVKDAERLVGRGPTTLSEVPA